MDNKLPKTDPPLRASAERASGHDPLEGVTPTGMIVTGAHRRRIPAVFSPLIERAIERFRAFEGTPSLYLYGSVATGTARVGASDVDLLTVGLAGPAARRLGVTLYAEFPDLCRCVEVGPVQPADYAGSGDEAYGNRVFLRHYCAHLAGPDACAGWPEFPADRAAARGFNGDIGLAAERWRGEFDRGAQPGAIGRRIARKTLLAVGGLVSVHDRTWTTDRVAAARRWQAVVPRLAGSLDALVAWSGGGAPAPAPADIRNALDGVVADVVDDFARRIGLWCRADTQR